MPILIDLFIPSSAQVLTELAGKGALIVIFTGALVVVGFLQFIAMRRQGSWMRRSVDVAGRSADAATTSAKAAMASAEAAAATVKHLRRTARKELRARVFVAIARRVGNNGPGSFSAELTVKNFGKIPAYDCTCIFALVLRTYPPNLTDFPKVNASGREPNIVLPPEGEFTLVKNLPENTFANTQHSQVGQEINAVYLYGKIQYKDGFAVERSGEFLMNCSGMDYALGRFAFCEIGNQAN